MSTAEPELILLISEYWMSKQTSGSKHSMMKISSDLDTRRGKIPVFFAFLLQSFLQKGQIQ